MREINRLENPEKNDLMHTEKAIAPLDPTEVSCTLIAEGNDSARDSERACYMGPFNNQSLTHSRLDGTQTVQTDTASVMSSDLFITPQRRITSSTDRTSRRSLQHCSTTFDATVHAPGAAADDTLLLNALASFATARCQQYCGSGNFSAHQIIS